MTARDVTGFYAFFSAWTSGNFPHFRAISLLNYTENPGEKGEKPLKKYRKIQWRRRPAKKNKHFFETPRLTFVPGINATRAGQTAAGLDLWSQCAPSYPCPRMKIHIILPQNIFRYRVGELCLIDLPQEFFLACPCNKKSQCIDLVCLYSPLANSACKGRTANPQSFSCPLKSPKLIPQTNFSAPLQSHMPK